MKTKSAKQLNEEFIKKHQGKHFCHCGCREVIKIIPDHRWEGIPKYIRWHYNKTKEVRERASKQKTGSRHTEKTKRILREKNVGTTHTIKTRRILKKYALERFKNGMPKETIKKITKTLSTLEAKEANRKRGLERFKNGRTKEVIEKIRKKTTETLSMPNIKKKMRLSAIKYIEENCGGMRPNIGHNENQILDEIELFLGYKIIRQFKIEGYFLDGYIPELNLAIEIDESFHRKQIKKDNYRGKEIINKLNCDFIRIKDNF